MPEGTGIRNYVGRRGEGWGKWVKEKRKAGMLGSAERREDKGPAAGEWPFDEEKKPEPAMSAASAGKEVSQED